MDADRLLEAARKRKEQAELLKKGAQEKEQREKRQKSGEKPAYSNSSRFADHREKLDRCEEFVSSEEFQNLLSDGVTITGEWKRETILATTEKVHNIECEEDLKKLSGKLNEFEVCLLASPDYPLHSLFLRARANVVKARMEGTPEGVGGPSFPRCLAWLARAAQTSPTLLIPRGEFFPSTDQYLAAHLTQESLPQMRAEKRGKMAVFQVGRCLDLLACLDLRLLTPEDASFLLFALCKISLDRLMDATVHSKVVSVINNLFSVSDEAKRKILLEFTHVFPYASDQLGALRLLIEIFRISDAAPYGCLMLCYVIFIHVTERAELVEPADILTLTEEHFVRVYVQLIIDVLPDLKDLYSEDKSSDLFCIMMMKDAMTPYVIEKAGCGGVEKILAHYKCRKRELAVSKRTDDYIIDPVVREMISRIEDKRMEIDTELKEREFSMSTN